MALKKRRPSKGQRAESDSALLGVEKEKRQETPPSEELSEEVESLKAAKSRRGKVSGYWSLIQSLEQHH